MTEWMRSDLHRLSPDIDTEGGLAALRGLHHRRRRTRVVGGALLVGGALVGLAFGIGRPSVQGPANFVVADGSTATTTAPVTPPIEPRLGASVIWTGSEMIVTGGFHNGLGGGASDLKTLTDGAAFEPISGTWRPIASQPEAPGRWAQSLWTGELVVLIGADGGLAYDPAEDTWTALPRPPFELPDLARDNLTFEAAWWDSSLIVWRPDTDQMAAYSLETELWSELPGPGLPASYPAKLLAGEGRLVALSSGWPSSTSAVSWDVIAAEWIEGGWRQAEPVGFSTEFSSNVAHIEAAAMVGSAVIVWGEHGTDPGPTWILDAAGQWTEAPPMPIASGKAAGSLVVNGRIVATTESPEIAVFAPETGTWTRVIGPGPASVRFSIWTGTELLGWDDASVLRWTPPEFE